MVRFCVSKVLLAAIGFAFSSFLPIFAKDCSAFIYQSADQYAASLKVEKVKESPKQKYLKQILVPINNYISGTSYGYADKLRLAFVPGAKMFLDHKDKPLFLMTIEEYAGRVERHTKNPGKFNGRVTNVLSVRQFKGIATAKLEVFIPRLKKRFVDLLLLKKLGDDWKIISKTAASESFEKRGGNVLLVLSNTKSVGREKVAVGNDFGEIVSVHSEYQKAGFHVDFVSPSGGRVSLEGIDASKSEQLEHLFDSDFMFALENTKTPTEIKADDYQVIQFVGGSAAIFDIPNNSKIQKLAMQIYEKNGGIIAANGLGTAAIANLKDSGGNFFVANKSVCGIPSSAQKKQETSRQAFSVVEKALCKHGAQFKKAEAGNAHAQVSGRLVTGPNTPSVSLVVKKCIELLEKK